MINCVTWETSHLFGDALVSQHRLRHRVFVERHGWQLPTHNGMEYDQFDTPAAVYLIWRDETNVARGATRLIPTDRPYMMRELWPHMITKKPLPQSPRIWEGTRLCVDRGLTARSRRSIIAELLCGCLEFGIQEDIEQFIILAPVVVLQRTYEAAGCSIEVLGPETEIEDGVVAAAECRVSRDILTSVRDSSGISGPVLRMVGAEAPVASVA